MTNDPTTEPGRKKWTPDEIALIKSRYPHEDTAKLAADLGARVKQVYEQAAYRGVQKSHEYLSFLRSKAACRIRDSGVKTRLRLGLVPWNKGKKHPPSGRSSETQFKSGNRPHNWLPVGSERLSKGGILQRKMTDTGSKNDWVPVHVLVFLASGKDLPEGHVVVFKDGNRTNWADIENLEAVSRGELMRRNSIHSYGPELARLYQLVGAVNRRINERKKEVS